MAKASFNPRRVLLVHAHPDDESLSNGHLIADRMLAGAEVFVLTLTRGERGKVKLADLKSLEGELAPMGAFRTAELMNALDEYTVEGREVQHAFAGTRHYLDSGMRVSAFGRTTRKRMLDEMSLAAVATPVIADDILKVMMSFRPDAVVTYNRKGGFGHPDHRKAHEATSMAIRRYSKTNRAPGFWVVAEPGERFDVEVGGPKTAGIKKAALDAHASQVINTAETYALVAGKEIRYDQPERLRKANPSMANALKPWFRSIWAIPLGVLTGIAGTMLHLIRTQDGVPVGLLVALIMVVSLAMALRTLRRSRGALYLMTVSFIITVLQLAQPSEEGSVFFLNATLSNWWLYGSIASTALIVLFPRLQPATWKRSASGHR